MLQLRGGSIFAIQALLKTKLRLLKTVFQIRNSRERAIFTTIFLSDVFKINITLQVCDGSHNFVLAGGREVIELNS